jgi:hypothetical protein
MKLETDRIQIIETPRWELDLPAVGPPILISPVKPDILKTETLPIPRKPSLLVSPGPWVNTRPKPKPVTPQPVTTLPIDARAWGEIFIGLLVGLSLFGVGLLFFELVFPSTPVSTPSRSEVAPVLTPVPTPEPTPAPTPVVEVRRAASAPLRIGQRYSVPEVPGIGPMSIFYCGELANASDLPPRGNSIGDAFRVGNHLWILAQPAGFTRAGWVDPIIE